MISMPFDRTNAARGEKRDQKTKDRLNGGRNYPSQGQSGRRQQKRANRARYVEIFQVLRDHVVLASATGPGNRLANCAGLGKD
jgi:hypothetical protein